MKNHVPGYMIFLDRKNRLCLTRHDISMFSFFISANILCHILHRIIAYHDHTRISNILNLQLYMPIHADTRRYAPIRANTRQYTPIHANTRILEKSCSNTDNDKR